MPDELRKSPVNIVKKQMICYIAQNAFLISDHLPSVVLTLGLIPTKVGNQRTRLDITHNWIPVSTGMSTTLSLLILLAEQPPLLHAYLYLPG
jgi:hypothetical protein